MKFSVVTLVAACAVSSTYAIDPNCATLNIVGSLGADCTNSLLTALVPTTGECVSTSIGSVHAIMNGDTAEGSAYLTPDCSGAPIVSVATTDEDVCVNAGIASFKLYCMDA